MGAGMAYSAHAERRVALVIGESTYRNVPRLPNPQKDAAAMAKLLKDAGFDTVVEANNVGNLDFKRALRRFADAADNADIAVLYYAGHGIEVGGVNYVIPIDAKLRSDRDAEDEAVSLNRMVESLEGATKLRLIILDACRDNPFIVAMKRLRRRVVMRGIRAGLTAVEPTGTNTLIAYAAKAGSTAEDGTGEHSPFTTALLDNLTVPGLDVRLAFGRVRDEVLKITSHRQEPFVYGSLGGGNIALVPAPKKPKVATNGKVKADYDLVAQVGTLKAWQIFLATYKTGFYADLARAQVAKLEKAERLAKLEPPRAPVPAMPTADELRAWDKVKNSSDKSALDRFIQRYPDSPLAVNAQHRLDMLARAAREREEKMRADREAAKKRAEKKRQAGRAARLAAEQAEKERQAKEAARLAAQQRAIERLAAQQRAIEEERAKEAARIAALKAENELRAKRAAESAQRQKKEDSRFAALKAENALRAKEATESARRRKGQAARIAALAAEIDRRAKRLADAKKKAMRRACEREQARLDDLSGAGANTSAREDLRRLSRDLTCERLRPRVVASLEKVTYELSLAVPRKIKVPSLANRPGSASENTPAQVASAQKELGRLGCYYGDDSGSLDAATKVAIKKYRVEKGLPATDADIAVNDYFVQQLIKEKLRVCPKVAMKKPGPAPRTENEPARDHPSGLARRRPHQPPTSSAKALHATPRASERASADGANSAPIGIGF